MRHNCSKMQNGKGWSHCSVCNGRIHLTDCTSKRDPAKDCCEARHKMLFERGQTVGMQDTSLRMYDEQFPTWAD